MGEGGEGRQEIGCGNRIDPYHGNRPATRCLPTELHSGDIDPVFCEEMADVTDHPRLIFIG